MDSESLYWTIGLTVTLFLGLSISVGIYLMELYNSPEKKRIRDEINYKKNLEKEKRKLNKLNLDGMEIVRFADFYKKRLETGFLAKEYSAVLKRYIPKTLSEKATSNEMKNLFPKYIPFEHNIVDIGPLKRHYINASWIPGNMSERQYIATQVPLQSTISDFWKMIWKYESYVIIMIGEEINSSKDIFNYTDPKAYSYEPYKIQIETSYETMDFKITKIRLFQGQYFRVITHIQFLTWTNIRITNPQVILELRRQMKKVVENCGGPVVVHCVSGCGRTGTFICIANLCDLVDKYKEDRTDQKISISHEVIRMRENRIMSVANLAQYKMIYESIIHYIVGGVTAIVIENLQQEMIILSEKSPNLGITRYCRQFNNASKVTLELSFADCAGGIRHENIDKNRHPLIIPRDRDRPYLRNVRIKGSSDYINAVYIDSFTVKNHFIVTEWPKNNTINDIWRLLFDKNIQVMVILNVFENSKNYRRFWPTILNQPTGSGPISVELIEDHLITPTIRCQIFNLAKINFEIKSSDISLLLSKGITIKKKLLGEKLVWQVFIFHLLNWKNENQVPDKLHDVISLIWLAEEFNTSSGYSASSRSPIVIMSQDGVKRVGVYCVVAASLERMRIYGDIDVYCAVVTVKRNRPELIQDLNEYLLCYELCLEYLNWSETEEDNNPEIE